MESQVERYETAFDEHYKAILDEDATLEEEEKNYDKFASDLTETITTMNALSDEVDDFIEKHKATANTNAGATASTAPSSSKIDDTLRPKETLLRSMNLEEFNVWSGGFDAYYRQNERILAGQSASVKRQILFNCVESSLVQALQTDSSITDATPIIGNDSCLTKLKEIFLKNNPLFLRRYDFQECVQKPNQSFPEWWALKLTKGQDCDLENITRDEVLLLEMIRDHIEKN